VCEIYRPRRWRRVKRIHCRLGRQGLRQVEGERGQVRGDRWVR